MKRIPLIVLMLIVAVSIVTGQKRRNRNHPEDEERLKQFVVEWADAAVHADVARLDKFHHDNFRGSAEGISFDKKSLATAIRSGQMKVARWDCNKEDMKVNIQGNSVVVTGRCTLSNATYMGKDFSGEWDFVDRFVKQRDGSWRAVSSQSKRIKQ